MPCTLRRAPFPGRTVGAGASSIGGAVGGGPADPTITHHRFLRGLLGAAGAAAAALCVAVLIAQALRVARRLSAAIPGARPPRWPAPPPPAAGGRTPGRRYRP